MRVGAVAVVLAISACASFASTNGASDAGTASPPFDASAAKRVFLTTNTIKPGSGADVIAEAESICVNDAKAAGIDRPVTVWLSASSFDAIDKLTSSGPWVLPSGTPVFAGKEEVFSAKLLHVIDEDATGGRVAPGALVWTGTNTGGRKAEHCGDWSGTAGTLGTAGDPTRRLDGGWTETEPRACAADGRLICFEN